MKRCKSILRRILKSYASRLSLNVMTDVGALAQACIGDSTGIVLIAGTGSICLGLGKRGVRRISRRSGGKGSFLDPGSGSTLGLAVLYAALATMDGRMNEDLLVDLICDRYGIRPEEIRSRFLPPERREVAGLARIALEAYEKGDTSAKTLVRTAVGDLVTLLLEVREYLKFSKGVKVFASGGLFASPIVRRLFKGRLARCLPGSEVAFIDDPLMKMIGSKMAGPDLKS
jgi:N-acetylglucosamine kinase-like BadF-type ATPase